jgi:hypothetical protein
MANRGRTADSIWDESPPGTMSAEGKKAQGKKINIRRVAAILQERGIEPIGEICDVLPLLDSSLKAKTLLSLAEFVYPKLGRTEITGADGGPVEVVGMTKEQRDAAVAAAARADT